MKDFHGKEERIRFRNWSESSVVGGAEQHFLEL